MSHTQCDARQRSRFELLSSEQWGHRGAGGINLLAYNTASLINGGSGEHSLKNATLSNSSIECCEKNNVLPDSGDWDNGQGRVVSTVILFFGKPFPLKQKILVLFFFPSPDRPRSESAAIPSSPGPSYFLQYFASTPCSSLSFQHKVPTDSSNVPW